MNICDDLQFLARSGRWADVYKCWKQNADDFVLSNWRLGKPTIDSAFDYAWVNKQVAALNWLDVFLSFLMVVDKIFCITLALILVLFSYVYLRHRAHYLRNRFYNAYRAVCGYGNRLRLRLLRGRADADNAEPIPQ